MTAEGLLELKLLKKLMLDLKFQYKVSVYAVGHMFMFLGMQNQRLVGANPCPLQPCDWGHQLDCGAMEDGALV